MKYTQLGGTFLVIAESDAEVIKVEDFLEAMETPTPTPTPTPSPSPTPTPTPIPSGGRVVPTFHCAGLYFNPPAAGPVQVRFVEKGGAVWRDGLDLWYDNRGRFSDEKARGSIVNLSPGTEYVVQFGQGGKWIAQQEFSTWSEAPKVKEVRSVTARTSMLDITQGGSASDGFIVYDGGGATINVGKSEDFTVRIRSPFVLLRNFILRGGKIDSVRIDEGLSDIWIERNDIADWGSVGGVLSGSGPQAGMQRAQNECAGIKEAYSSSGASKKSARIVIQRNRIHDPSYGANSWDYGHPSGANGVFMGNVLGNHVIRYNQIYVTGGDIRKFFNDGIGGTDNFSQWGMPGRQDCDIYGNVILHCMDDAIEAEGGNMNVRVWGNYMDQVAIGIATTIVDIGPFYGWKNVLNRCRTRYGRSPDDDDRLQFSKSRTPNTGGTGNGRRYLFNNTCLQAPPSGSTYPLGCGGGITGGSTNEHLDNTVSRNNIWHVFKSGWPSITSPIQNCDLNFDLYNGSVPSGTQANGVKGTPQYEAGHGPTAMGAGLYRLASSSPGKGKGVRIPNFCEGSSIDPGAHQPGEPPMTFGVNV